MTARTSKPGVSISPADIEALAGKRVTLQDLADRERCTKQNISKRIRAMRSSPPTAPTGPMPPAGSVLINAHQAVVSANLGILSYVNATLESGAVLGPSALKALSAAIASARSELSVLGILVSDDEDTGLSTLTVRVMTDAEHDEIKRRIELADEFED